MEHLTEKVHNRPPKGNDDLEHGVRLKPSSGINVLIVGAGVGGLTAALECHRRGHTVRVLERSAVASAEGTRSITAVDMMTTYRGLSYIRLSALLLMRIS